MITFPIIKVNKVLLHHITSILILLCLLCPAVFFLNLNEPFLWPLSILPPSNVNMWICVNLLDVIQLLSLVSFAKHGQILRRMPVLFTNTLGDLTCKPGCNWWDVSSWGKKVLNHELSYINLTQQKCVLSPPCACGVLYCECGNKSCSSKHCSTALLCKDSAGYQ